MNRPDPKANKQRDFVFNSTSHSVLKGVLICVLTALSDDQKAVVRVGLACHREAIWKQQQQMTDDVLVQEEFAAATERLLAEFLQALQPAPPTQ